MLRLILRRLGRGNWSPVVLAYDPDRQHQLPTGVEARVGAVFAIGGVSYRVSRVEA